MKDILADFVKGLIVLAFVIVFMGLLTANGCFDGPWLGDLPNNGSHVTPTPTLGQETYS